MSSPTKTLQTGTAADLIHFETIHHVTKQCDRLTRVATTSEEWIVKDWDGETYCIRFDKNFSKKHLFTFSKDTEKTKAKAHDIAQANPGQDEGKNWHDAEMALLCGKIAKNLDKRAQADTCACGHKYVKHLHNNPAGGPKIPGPCTLCAAASPCAGFATPYGIARKYVGKPTYDPLSGATTKKNTCIILNWVPRAEFEDVVLKSIQGKEKPPGWTKGNPLLPVNTEVELKWDFGLGRKGVILKADKSAPPNITYTDYQGCWIKAKKTATAWGKQTWEIFHMETQAPHEPF